MEPDLDQRALNGARAVATAHGVACDHAHVIHSGSNVVVRLAPAPVVARVMAGTVVLHDDPRRWLAREVSVLEFLAPSGVAVAPSRLIDPGPHHHDGLWITFTEWVPDVEPGNPHRDAGRLGAALRSLHGRLRPFDGDLGDLGELRARVERLRQRLVPSEHLGADAIASLGLRLDAAAGAVIGLELPVQAIHGDASLRNLLVAGGRLVWNDFEDTFRGPVHWDLAGYVMDVQAAGATPEFVRVMLDHYGWQDDERALAPFMAVHEVYDEIWGAYDRQRRAGSTAR
jgi:hypothetical protein